MSLIEQRHPRLGRLMQLWRAHCRDDAPPFASAVLGPGIADLAPATVLVTRAENGSERLTITESGSEVDALYSESLVGASVQRLAPDRGNAALEAMSAIETARPVFIEDEFRIDGDRRRVARVYLPLANEDGSVDGVQCGIVAVN